MTRLESFLQANKIKPARLARIAGISRQYLLRVRMGRVDPTRHMMARITLACMILSKRTVRLDKLFDLMDTGL